MKARCLDILAITSVFLLCVRVQSSDEPNKWYYGEDGEKNWDEQCDGQRQSPINVITSKVRKYKATPHDSQLIFHNYDQPIDVKFHNNGHTTEIKIPKSEKINIEGGILHSFYRLVQIHFHWESEHTINSKRWPLEAHFVHIKSQTPSFDEAVQKNETVVVLASLFYYDSFDNEKFSKVAPTLRNVSKMYTTDQSTVMPMSLLPADTSAYYTYNGSLTTPPCAEIVTWIIFENMVPISRKQWNIFKKMETINGTSSLNYRRTTPIGSRDVLHVEPCDHKRFSRTNLNDAPVPASSALVLGVMLALCLSNYL